MKVLWTHIREVVLKKILHSQSWDNIHQNCGLRKYEAKRYSHRRDGIHKNTAPTSEDPVFSKTVNHKAKAVFTKILRSQSRGIFVLTLWSQSRAIFKQSCLVRENKQCPSQPHPTHNIENVVSRIVRSSKQKWYWTEQCGNEHSLKQCAHRAEAVLTEMVNSQNWYSIHLNSALIIAAAVFTEALLTKMVNALRQNCTLIEQRDPSPKHYAQNCSLTPQRQC